MKKCKQTGKICLTANQAKERFDKLEKINSSYLCPYCGFFHISCMSRNFYKRVASKVKPKPKNGIPEQHIQNRIKNLTKQINTNFK